jgi:hypothetical protein
MQAATDARQHKQSEENGRVLASIGTLADAIAELSQARQQEAASVPAGSEQDAR